MFELLDTPLAAITDFYGDQLHELLRERHQPAVATPSTDYNLPL
ncbi:hypothetical protein ACFQVB_40105 [Paraburkholderia humisilvae]